MFYKQFTIYLGRDAFTIIFYSTAIYFFLVQMFWQQNENWAVVQFSTYETFSVELAILNDYHHLLLLEYQTTILVPWGVKKHYKA